MYSEGSEVCDVAHTVCLSDELVRCGDFPVDFVYIEIPGAQHVVIKREELFSLHHLEGHERISRGVHVDLIEGLKIGRRGFSLHELAHKARTGQFQAMPAIKVLVQLAEAVERCPVAEDEPCGGNTVSRSDRGFECAG